jgi:hypothetical protein
MIDVIHDGNIQCNLLKIFKKIFLNSNLRKVNCIAYFVVLRREPIKWAQCSRLFDEFLCKLGFFGTSAKKAQFTQERVEYNVFLFDEPLKGSKSLKIFKISLTFCFDN